MENLEVRKIKGSGIVTLLIFIQAIAVTSMPQWLNNYDSVMFNDEMEPTVQPELPPEEKKTEKDNVLFNSYELINPRIIEHFCSCIDIQYCPAAASMLRKKPQQREDIDLVRSFTCGFNGFRPLLCCNLFIEVLIGRRNKKKRAHFSYEDHNNYNSQPQYIDPRSPHHFYWDSMSFPHWSHAPTDENSGHECWHPHSYSSRPGQRRRTTTTTEEPYIIDAVEPETPAPVEEITTIPIEPTPTSTTQSTPAVEASPSESPMTPVPEEVSPTPASPPPETTTVIPEVMGRDSKRTMLSDQICGTTLQSRIVGGEDAKLGDYPWMARLGYRRNGAPAVLFRCGGSLINDRYVLTAAHCVINLPVGLELVVVRLGELDERTDLDCEGTSCADPPRDIPPANVTVHPSYNNPRLSNDVALIRLNDRVQFTNYISPLCLPFEQSTDFVGNLSGSAAIVAGWGSTNTGVSSGSPTLKWVRLTVIPTDQCRAIYRSRFDIVISDQQICTAGVENVDACEGDSGGPLFVDGAGDRRATLVGIVSFGPRRCGTAALPGVYASVQAYLNWILDTLQI